MMTPSSHPRREEALAHLRASYAELTPGQKVTADIFRPEDAPGVGRLFFQVYGGDYPVDEPYVPELLIEANRTGRIRTVVVRTPDGSIACQAAFFRSSPPNPRMYEYGQVMVDKAYRNSFAAYRLHQFNSKKMFGQLDGVDALYGETVCYHVITQKMSTGSGFYECGLELGLMSEASYAGEGITGRVSCMLFVRLDHDTPGALCIPACWQRQVEETLPTWPLTRDISISSPEVQAPANSKTNVEVRHFDFVEVTRLTISSIGADFAQRMDQIVAEARDNGTTVVQFFLCLGQAWTGQAAEHLRQRGCYFAGFFPQWFGTQGQGPDSMLAQLFLKPAPLAPLLAYSERGAAVARRVIQDMQRACREFGAPEVSPLPDLETLGPQKHAEPE